MKPGPTPARLLLPETVPVFPLPEAVFFPRTVLPLHIFEPRYRAMVREAHAGDRIIAMALLKPGWEPEYYGSPAVYDLGCAGWMEDVVELPGHRYNIKLSGICRVRFEAFEQEQPYRVARVTRVPENVPAENTTSAEQTKRGLLGAYTLMMDEAIRQPMAPLNDATDMSLQVLVNTFCAQLNLPVATKQQLLLMDDVLERGLALTDLILRESHRLRRRRDTDGDSDSDTRNDETVH